MNVRLCRRIYHLEDLYLICAVLDLGLHEHTRQELTRVRHAIRLLVGGLMFIEVHSVVVSGVWADRYVEQNGPGQDLSSILYALRF